MKQVDPNRSLAAKRGWETRRRRKRIALRLKISLGVRKASAEKRVPKVKGKSSRESELEARIAELEIELITEKQLAQRIREDNAKLKHRIKRIRLPWHVEASRLVKKDKEAADKAIVEAIESKVKGGWEFYAALWDTYEEINLVEGYGEIDDIREAWENEGESPEA